MAGSQYDVDNHLFKNSIIFYVSTIANATGLLHLRNDLAVENSSYKRIHFSKHLSTQRSPACLFDLMLPDAGVFADTVAPVFSTPNVSLIYWACVVPVQFVCLDVSTFGLRLNNFLNFD